MIQGHCALTAANLNLDPDSPDAPMDSIGFIIPVLLLAYLLGSVSCAILVCDLFRLPDPRQQGSLNPGATNVYRIGGVWPALLTLLGDSLKGVLAVAIARLLDLSPTGQGLVAIAAILGHMFPIFFKLQGGKGVATCLGAGLVLAWPTTLALTALWILVMALFRIASLASLCASLAAAPVALFLNPEHWRAFLVVAVLILLRHHRNILALVRGQEPRTDR